MINIDKLFKIGNFYITNTISSTIIVDIIIIIFIIIINIKKNIIPNKIQVFMECVILYFEEIFKRIAVHCNTEITNFICSWSLAFFIFIAVANLTGQVPGFHFIKISVLNNNTITTIPLFRISTSDINLTLALAFISIFLSHFFCIKCKGIKTYCTKFITLKAFPIFLFVGVIEFISEIVKIISLSFRLFGNILAGELVIKKIYNLFAFCVPVPFIIFEIIVSLVQAYVFAVLTMVFMNIMLNELY
ncbi:MAG: F0F1 ATP synthase subunit A [Endomicrobium sp.]|jgi:F-type H+-transporting ATPase subunit a|nr:F0F1 ATP synthase subunit A [Endomicrobium sp.]